MGVRALTVVVVLASVAVVAGCGGDGDDPPAASVPSGSAASADPTTSTTVGVDEVPDEITVEYVQRVMDALDASWGDMYRLYVASGGPSAETAAWLDALYDEPELSRIDIALGREAADGFGSTEDAPGDPTTRVLRILSSSPACIYVEADRQLDALFATTGGEGRSIVVLRRGDSSSRNPTAWSMTVDGRVDALPEADPCG